MTTADARQVPGFNPNYQQNNPDDDLLRKFGKWMGEHKIITTAGITTLIGGLAATGIVGLSRDKESPDSLHELGADRPYATAPVVPGETTYSPDFDLNSDGKVDGADFDLMDPRKYAREVPESMQLADVTPKLQKHMPSALENLRPHLSPEELALLSMPDLSKPRVLWSGQDYDNYYTIGLALVSSQGTKPSQIAEGQRALASVMDPENSNFDKTLEDIEKGLMFQNVYRALPSPFTDTELTPGMKIAGQTVTEAGGRLVLSHYVSADDQSFNRYFFYLNRDDGNGNINTKLVGTYDQNNPDIRALLK